MSAQTNVVADVARAYDRCARRYGGWLEPSWVRARYLRAFTGALKPGSRVLDLGCGPGDRVLASLTQRFYAVGVDVSAGMLELAAANAPAAALVRADMATLRLRPASLDGVVLFFAMFHVPRSSHARLLAEVSGALKPGGMFAATMGAADVESLTDPGWLSSTMYWSHFDSDANRKLVEAAGFSIELSEVAVENDERFWWVLARREL